MEGVLFTDLVALFDKATGAGFGDATPTELLTAQSIQVSPSELGAKNWAGVLRTRMLLSTRDANRRVRESELLGSRCSLTGQPLEPAYAATAAARECGRITAEHVRGPCSGIRHRRSTRDSPASTCITTGERVVGRQIPLVDDG
ncbi:DUF222 domain-containing protein [Mycobacterium sp. MBM]|nr:DUF222 domain-containing protein [Mycobacterium sp. MBM]